MQNEILFYPNVHNEGCGPRFFWEGENPAENSGDTTWHPSSPEKSPWKVHVFSMKKSGWELEGSLRVSPLYTLGLIVCKG